MSPHLVITAVIIEKRPVAEVVATCVDKSGTVTLRVASQLRHIGIGRPHAGTHVILLVQDLDVRIVNAITGELLRELTIDLTRDYQPRTSK